MRLPPLGVSAVVAVVAASAAGYALGLGPGGDASVAVVTTPMAWIDNLSDGDVLPIGTHVVNSHAAAPEGIASMTLDVNGEQQTEERSGNTLERVDWGFDASEPGDYLISVWGTTRTGEQTPVSAVNVLVIDTDELTPIALSSGAGSEITPIPTPGNTASASTPTPTASPSSSPSPSPRQSPTPRPSPTSSPTPTSSQSPTPSPTTPSPTPTPSPTTPSPTPTGPCTPSAPVLQSPSDGSSIQYTPTTLTWARTGSCEPELWQVQLSLEPGYDPAEYDQIISADQDQYATETLETCETWYWRVRGINETGEGAWSQIYRFTVFIRGC